MRFVVLALVACGGAAHPTAGDGRTPWASSMIDWSSSPKPSSSFEIAPPPIEELHLANGIRVLLVENHRLPIVEIATLHHAAGGREDGSHPGIAALTLDLLDEGAGAYSATDLAVELEREGAQLELTIATDYARLQLVTLSAHLARSIDLLATVITQPRFTDADLARVAARRFVELTQHVARPRTVAAQVFDRVLFAGFPYAQPAEGLPRSLEALGIVTSDVRAFWASAYGPATTTVIVAGDVTRADLVRMLEHGFGSWRATREPRTPPALTAEPQPQIVYVDQPDSDSALVIGRRVPTTNDLAAEVANNILGGNTDARLDRKLRDELGITYAAGASFWRGEWAATWGVATAFKREATADGIRATLALIESMRTVDAPPSELRRAKAAMTRGVAQAFDNTATTVRAIEYLVAQRLPLDYYATYARELDAVTPQAARAAIAQQWTDLSIVIVGDWSVIGDRIRGLGLPVTAAP